MGNIFGNIVNIIFIIIGLVIGIGIFARIITYCFSKEKCINATVLDKQIYDKRIYRKNQAPFTQKVYVKTFLCGNKTKNFNVSELSFENYKVNQKGILKYKGNRIIDFK